MKKSLTAIVLLVLVLLGVNYYLNKSNPAKAPDASATNNQMTSSNKELIVSLDGAEIGRITIDKDNNGSLQMGDNVGYDQLKKDWAEISSRVSLNWKHDKVGPNGEMQLVGEQVKAGDSNYIYGLLDTLEKEFGYEVTIDQ